MRAFRLDPDVRPTDVDVDIQIDPNVDDRVRGRVEVGLDLAARRRVLELHAVDLRVHGARLHIDGTTQRGTVVARPERETVQVRFASSIPPGSARLELSFSGRLRRDLRGLYAAQVGERRFAFSQLAPASARRLFPCFDEPAMKARWKLAVTTGIDNQVICNTPLERREVHADGRQTLTFERTPRLSSYLIAVAVGDLECSPAVKAGTTEIRVWHVPGKQGMADFALEVARESLLRLAAWFDLPYPYEKLDLVAVPDFEFGAMENPGAVFFREALLLTDRDAVSAEERKRVAEVICHELAHMWYGNLVTMAWWDDLWLNESFATWMAFEILNAWHPEWCMWQSFVERRNTALDLDALGNTHPIYTPVRTPDDAMANFDAITYEKGAAVIRMLERFLGPEVFRAGVRAYMREHREANAVATDLWRALSEASGQRVDRIARAWIEQPGHPALSVRRTHVDGRAALELRQERFALRPRKRRAGERAPRWPVPWVGRIGDGDAGHSHLVRHLLTRTRERIPATLADLTFVYGNADEACFLRPQHDEGDFDDLLADIGSLQPTERLGFVDHQWAHVRAGRAPMSRLLDLAATLGTETDPDVLAAVHRPLELMTRRLAPDTGVDVEQRLRAWLEVYYGGQVDELGWDPAEGEDERTRERRALIPEIVGGLGRASAVLATAEVRCREYLAKRGSLDPNLADAVVSMAALHGDAELHAAFVEALHGARTPQDQRRFLMALADFAQPELVKRTLEMTLSGDVASQDVAFVLARMLGSPAAREQTWSFIQRRWTKLRRSMGALLTSRVIAATPALGTRAHRAEVARFFKANGVAASSRSLRQALERFDWYAEYRRRAAPQLADYLAGR